MGRNQSSAPGLLGYSLKRWLLVESLSFHWRRVKWEWEEERLEGERVEISAARLRLHQIRRLILTLKWLFGLSPGWLNLPRERGLGGSGNHRSRVEALDNVGSPKISTGEALAEGLSLVISRRRGRLCLRSHHLSRKWAALDLYLSLLAHSFIYKKG